MLATTKTRNAEQTRAQLLNAAKREFARHGFHGARVERIVKQAGCNMRMLYHYFDNKENLYLKVLEAVYFDIRNKERQLNLTAHEPREALRRLVRFTWEHFLANRIFIDITRNENLVGGRFIRKSVVISEMSSPLIEAISDILDRGLESGEFQHDADPLQLYVSIVALCSHHLNNAHTLSAAFGTDLRDEGWLEARLHHVEAMALRFVGATEAARKGIERRQKSDHK